MYVILTYDVQQKRVAKVHKVCKRYLNHSQRSVFEGNISEFKLNSLKKELFSLIVPQSDSVKYARKEQIGFVRSFSNII